MEVQPFKKRTWLWHEANVEAKMRITPRSEHFWKFHVQKVHAVVARSTFGSQNAQSTPFLEHFWKLICSKSALRFGAKHMPKSNCEKHTPRSDHFGSSAAPHDKTRHDTRRQQQQQQVVVVVVVVMVVVVVVVVVLVLVVVVVVVVVIIVVVGGGGGVVGVVVRGSRW